MVSESNYETIEYFNIKVICTKINQNIFNLFNLLSEHCDNQINKLIYQYKLTNYIFHIFKISMSIHYL